MVKNDLVLVIGTMLSLDDKKLLSELDSAKIALISVMEDLPLMDRVDFFSRYEAGSEEGIIAILAKEFLKDKNISSDLKNYFDELDEGYISAETNIGEEEIEELHVMLQEAKSPLIIFGKDLFLNSKVENISRFINLISKFSDIEIKCLGELKQDDSLIPNEIEELKSFDGTVVFEYKSEDDLDSISGSAQFAVAAKLKDGQDIEVKGHNRKFILDKKLKGTIALMPSEFDEDSYRFKVAKITKREVQ